MVISSPGRVVGAAFGIEGVRIIPGTSRAISAKRSTQGKERTMTGVALGTEREQVVRWMEEGRTILEIIVKLLNDSDQFKAAAEAAQRENDRLRQECEQLRGDVNQLKADHERSKKERAEIAQWFSGVMSEAASRLLAERPQA
jgi:regulator of replication initiation timing